MYKRGLWFLLFHLVGIYYVRTVQSPLYYYIHKCLVFLYKYYYIFIIFFHVIILILFHV